MAELNDVTGGETITATFTNQVKNRTVMRYADAASRDASIPAPVGGDLAYLQDVDRITYYDDTSWVEMGAGLYLLLTGGTLSGDLNMDGPGISYPGSTVGGGSPNVIGFRWADPNIVGTVDNALGKTLANTDQVALIAGAGTFTSYVVPADASARNITISASPPTGGIDGDVWMQT